MSDGQYDKDDIITGNEYIQELQNVRDRASSTSGARKRQKEHEDIERA